MNLVEKYKQLKFEKYLKNEESDFLEFQNRYILLPKTIYSYMSNKDKFWTLDSTGIHRRSLISIDELRNELRSHLKGGRFFSCV